MIDACRVTCWDGNGAWLVETQRSLGGADAATTTPAAAQAPTPELALPLEEPVLVFAVAMAAFLVGPLIAKRLGQPGIVGIVVLGAALGPNALGLVERTDAFVLLGEVGLLYLLFTVGFALDVGRLREAPQEAAFFGVTSYAIPFVVGTPVVAVALGLDPLAALLLGAVFASHTLLAYPVVDGLNVTSDRAVTAVFGGILFSDTLALFVLALVMGATGGAFGPQLVVRVVLSLATLFAAVWLVVPLVARWFFRRTGEESYFEFLLVMVVLFGSASLATLLGLSGILGAFVAGLAINSLVTRGGTLRNRIEFVGNAFFVPFFLFYVGLLVDPAVLVRGWETLWTAGVVIAVMLVTKYAAAWVVAAVQGYDADQRDVAFGLSIGQAAAALAITLLGFDRGLFDAAVLNAVVVMLLVTAVLSPWLTERAARRLARGIERDLDAAVEGEGSVLLALSHHSTVQSRLLELAFVLVAGRDGARVSLLRVVQPGRGRSTERDVARAKRDLGAVAELGGGAELPVGTEVRINDNVASGIVQGSIEVGADVVLLGWDGRPPLRRRIFGSIIDQVLDRTALPVLVSRLGHPINTTARLVVVVPAGALDHGGFAESVAILERVAVRLGAPMTVLGVEGAADGFDAAFRRVDDVRTSVEVVRSWARLEDTLWARTNGDDLVTVVAPRPGDVGWREELRDLPATLAALPPHSFVVVHPGRREPEYEKRFLRFE